MIAPLLCSGALLVLTNHCAVTKWTLSLWPIGRVQCVDFAPSNAIALFQNATSALEYPLHASTTRPTSLKQLWGRRTILDEERRWQGRGF